MYFSLPCQKVSRAVCFSLHNLGSSLAGPVCIFMSGNPADRTVKSFCFPLHALFDGKICHLLCCRCSESAAVFIRYTVPVQSSCTKLRVEKVDLLNITSFPVVQDYAEQASESSCGLCNRQLLGSC